MNAKIHLTPSPEFNAKTRLWQGIPGVESMPGGRLWAIINKLPESDL